jgi:uncharacterized protein with NRDE domain
MNRDESRLRHEGDFNQRLGTDNPIFFPTDALAGGTWFGANRKGLVLALLNRYQASNPNGFKSRGLLIPSFLAQWDHANQVRTVRSEDCIDYNPFDLIASDQHQTWRLSWDGQTVTHNLHDEEAFAFSSSALNTHEILGYRQGLFSQWNEQRNKTTSLSDVATSVLSDFHLVQKEQAQTQSVFMDRHEAHTKSICQVTSQPWETELHYFNDAVLTDFRTQHTMKENLYDHGLMFKVME